MIICCFWKLSIPLLVEGQFNSKFPFRINTTLKANRPNWPAQTNSLRKKNILFLASVLFVMFSFFLFELLLNFSLILFHSPIPLHKYPYAHGSYFFFLFQPCSENGCFSLHLIAHQSKCNCYAFVDLFV